MLWPNPNPGAAELALDWTADVWPGVWVIVAVDKVAIDVGAVFWPNEKPVAGLGLDVAPIVNPEVAPVVVAVVWLDGDVELLAACPDSTVKTEIFIITCDILKHIIIILISNENATP